MRTATASNRRLASLSFFLLVCYAASIAGGVVTYAGLDDWYNGLQKPSWTPARDVFGPVSTTLYGMMAVSAWLIWDRFRGGAFPALKLFGYQLALNVIWSFLFFALRNPDAAAAEIIILWLFVGATTYSFLRLHRTAGLLLLPYWAWISFAAILNHEIAQLN